jgi:type VI secretion system protein ImpL
VPTADAVSGAGQSVTRPSPPLRSATERREAADRLEYACIQLQQARLPLAAINGIVVMLPLQVHRSADADAVSLGQAVGEDLATVTRVLGLRAPVTLVGGVLQDDPAIDDLLTRLDAGKRAAACGHPFPPGLPPTPELMQALAFNATGSLNDTLAELLLDPRRIADQPANRHLLAMLGRLRLHVATQLARLLPQAFSPDLHSVADGRGGGMPPLAGCYVASLSPAASRRAFVRGMLDAVLQTQGELAWTDESLRADVWADRVSRILFGATAVMVTAIVAIVWWRVSR